MEEKTPEDFGLTGKLWTFGQTREYIPQSHKRADPVGLQEALGHDCQRPAERARKQNSNGTQRWKNEEYPAVSKRAEAENAIIYWADETGVSNCEIVERGFSPKGRPPVPPVETKRQRVNMISAISNQGKVRFTVHQDTMNQQRLNRFTTRLIRASERNVSLIPVQSECPSWQACRSPIGKAQG